MNVPETLLGRRLLPALLSALALALAPTLAPAPSPDRSADAAPVLSGGLAAQEVDGAFLAALRYRSVGPYRGGRVTAVAGVPDEPFLFYMGSTGGGVFKTDDAGESWTSITDGQFLVSSVGAIAVAPSDANVIWVGTGSAEPRGNTSPGKGVYRSTDAGKTWSHVGLRDAGQIGSLQVHPRDPDVAFVAATGDLFGRNDERGVFRTTDGGDSWENVLFINDSTGVADLAMDPTNPRILYATAWRAQRLPWTMISGSMEGGIYRSKDGGDTWQKLSAGLPQGLFGKAGLAVSPANPNRVWAIIEAGDDQGGVYRSDNGGDSWRRVTAEKGLISRAWYYMRITADPVDENTVYVNNVLFYRSVDGGRTFIPIPTVPHPDSHDVWINPNNPDIMIEGDDGGATVTLNGGRTWSTQRNQATAELYRVTVDDQFPYRLYGAQQDNSTISVPSRVSSAMVSDTEAEYQVGGCESGHIAVDPRGHNIVYAGCFGGSVSRFDVRTKQIREIIPWPENQMAQEVGSLRYRFQWNAPTRISPHDPDVVYHVSNHVHRTTNAGQTWETISPDLTTNNPDHQGFAGGPITADGTGVEVYGTIFALEESETEAGVIWAGSDDGLIHVTRDNGANWTDVTPGDFPEGATVNSIDISAFRPGRVLVAAYNYRMGDPAPYIFATNDYGESWDRLTDGTNGIPADHFVRVVREDPEREGLLFAGTEFGMYASFNGGETWQSFQRNLPVTPVTDLHVHHGDLVLSTQGRSFWIMDDITPLRTMTDAAMASPATLYPIRDAHRVTWGGAMQLGGAGRRAQNPPEGALITYSLGEEVEGPVIITITNASGDTVKTFSSEESFGPDLGAFAELAAMFGFGGGGGLLPKTPGLHRVNWDLKKPAPRLPAGTVIFGSVSQPAAVPGDFTVTLDVDGDTQSQPLRLLPDPRSNLDLVAFQQQDQFLEDLGGLIERLAERQDELNSVRSQVQGVAGVAAGADLAAEDLERVQASAADIGEKLTGVEEEVRQTRSRSFYDPLDYPGKLAADLAYLYNTAAGGFGGATDAPPTDAALERMEELRAEANRILGDLQVILDSDLAEFNELIRSLGLDPVVVKKEGQLIS
jgi:photosystem II stability/assembly factor-like uncharacterized protein